MPPGTTHNSSSPNSESKAPVGSLTGRELPVKAFISGSIGGLAIVAIFLVFYFYIWPRRHVKKLGAKGNDALIEHKAELHHDEVEAISDMKEATERGEGVELYGEHLELFEMLAVEEVSEVEGK